MKHLKPVTESRPNKVHCDSSSKYVMEASVRTQKSLTEQMETSNKVVGVVLFGQAFTIRVYSA